MSAVGLLSVVQNVQLGYSETLCVKCANTASKDTISKQWNIIQQRDCAVVLGNESPVTYTPPIIGYVPKDPCLVKRPLDASITLEYCKPDSQSQGTVLSGASANVLLKSRTYTVAPDADSCYAYCIGTLDADIKSTLNFVMWYTGEKQCNCYSKCNI